MPFLITKNIGKPKNYRSFRLFGTNDWNVSV